MSSAETSRPMVTCDTTVPTALAAAVQRGGPEIAIEMRGRRRSRNRFAEDVARLAQGLVDLGVRPGHRVAIVCGMHLEAVTSLHAVLRIGAVATLHDPESTTRELRRMFEDHSAVLAIADRSALGALRSLPDDVHPKALVSVEPVRRARDTVREAVRTRARTVRRLPRLVRSRARPGAGLVGHDHALAWRDLLASSPLKTAHPHPSPRDLAMLQYTAGPDGVPLGAMITHGNLVANARQLDALLDGETGSRHAVCASLPLHEPAGAIIGAVAPLIVGRPLVLAPQPADLISATRRTRPVAVAAPPAVLLSAALMPQAAAELASVPHPMTFPEGTDPHVLERLCAALDHRLDIGDARPEYGISFTGTYEYGRPHKLGRPLDGVGALLEGGELRVAGPQVFHGYWNRPDETAHVLSGDGWVRTGERGRAAGSSHEVELVTPNVDRIISPDGRVISPREVSATLLGHPEVAAAEVTGVSLPDGGQTVHAEVQVREGADCTEEELRDFVAERLAPVKVPRSITLTAAAAHAAPAA